MAKRKVDDYDVLYRAVQKYVENRAGKVVVIGGVEIQEWPGEAKGKFRVAIHCTGTKPICVKKEEPSP